MIDPRVVEHLIPLLDRFPQAALRAKLISDGFSAGDVDDSMAEALLRRQAPRGFLAGRLGRGVYAMYALPLLAVSAASLMWMPGGAGRAAGLLCGLTIALLGIPRCHDLGRSGWWTLMFLAPPFNLALLLGLLARAGTPGPNDFGAALDGSRPPEAAPRGLGIPMGVQVFGVLVLTAAVRMYIVKISRDAARESGAPPPEARGVVPFGTRQAVPAPKDDGRKALQDAALRGDSDAAYRLGVSYGNQAEPPDFAAAARWYTMAGTRHAAALVELGRLYRHGWGVEKDPVKGAKLWVLAARLGSAEAMCELGDAYASGRPTAVDAAESFKWGEMARLRAIQVGDKGLQRKAEILLVTLSDKVDQGRRDAAMAAAQAGLADLGGLGKDGP